MSQKIMTVQDIMSTIEKEAILFVDLRFTDTVGKEQHITVPVSCVNKDFFEEGKAFDGSSIRGWAEINKSDMLLMPIPESAFVDPFFEHKTIVLRCNVLDPRNMLPYERDPRSLALRAEAYLQSTGIADKVLFGPEPEFFIFDSMRYKISMDGCSYSIGSKEGAWSSDIEYPDNNSGHRPAVKGGYFPVPPIDSFQDMRSDISLIMESLGVPVEALHHEVATAGQNELAMRFNTMVLKADEMQVFKYVVQNVAHQYGKTATFMPKPLFGDNGNGMHCHQSLSKNGENMFSGEKYAGMSDTALYYIGGILKHAKALNAFTNPSTNSYRRLVPGFEAPVMLAYSAQNRSASIRIPHVTHPKAKRIEVRFPDPMANPYLAFSAMLMAGLDGIKNKILPGEPMDKDLYDLPPEEARNVPKVAASLSDALDALNVDREFLTVGDVFSDDYIDAYIELKKEDIQRISMIPHPAEFEMYYSL